MQTWRPIPGPFDTPRDLEDFEPFPSIPEAPEDQLDHWLNTLRIQPISAVEWDWAEGWAVGPRVINDSMWFWFERGNGWGWVGDAERRFRIRAGDLMLIPQGARHMVGQDEGERSHVFAIHFYAHIVGGINLLDLLGFPAHFPGSPDAPYRLASHSLAHEFAVAVPGWATAMVANILCVLFYMIRRHGSSMHLPQGTTGHPDLLRLLPALEMIEQRISDPELTVGHLAAKVCMSESQFRKLFHRVTGMGPVHFIQGQRIKRACAILRTSDLSIGRISELCGFNDQSFFVRIFKAQTGASPGHYRKVREL